MNQPQKIKLGNITESQIVIGDNNKTEQYMKATDPEKEKTLTEASPEIQQLLNQLQQNQNLSLEDAQHQVAKSLVTQAQSDSTFRRQLIKWGQSLGDAAAKTTVSEVVKGVVKLSLGLL